MLKKIVAFLRAHPRTKAKVIASHIDADKNEVNHVLYSNSDIFRRDSDFTWSLLPADTVEVVLSGAAWITAEEFEKSLSRSESPLDSARPNVTFVLQEDCKIRLDALARLLALCNQLIAAGKSVVLDFTSCKATLSYLNRIGFVSQLDGAVQVLPARPKADLAKVYEGNNEGVVELRVIDPGALNEQIPELLRRSFV